MNIKTDKQQTLISRHTEGRYKDGQTIVTDKKIYDDGTGPTIKFHKKHNKDETTILIKSNKDGTFTYSEEINKIKTETNNVTLDELINKIKHHKHASCMKFIINYFTDIKQQGGQYSCNTLHGGACSGSKCKYLILEEGINNNKYITRASLNKMQRYSSAHKKLSKKMSKRLSKKIAKRTSKTNYKLPKSS